MTTIGKITKEPNYKIKKKASREMGSSKFYGRDCNS